MKQLIVALMVLLYSLVHTGLSQAQEEINPDAQQVECGDIIEGEFSQDFELVDYLIDLEPGQQITIQATPVGEALEFAIVLLGPTNLGITLSNRGYNSPDPAIVSGVLSARGRYVIRLSNAGLWEDGRIWTARGGVGVYNMFIRCILRDGTVIEPGDSLLDDEPTTDDSIADVQAAPEFSGFGFPGLNPVDFTTGVTVPLQADIPNSGSVSPGFDGIFGYSFTGSAGETVTLEFIRQSGNLNLGLVVLSADNQVAFQASLMNSNSLTTEFMLPTDSEYTIGVFRIDLLPVDAPENTSFTITVNQ